MSSVKNTIAFPAAARGKTVVCGKCKSPLPEPGTILEPGAEGIDALFRNSSLPVLADFFGKFAGILTAESAHKGFSPLKKRLYAAKTRIVAEIEKKSILRY